jgi:aldose 1-epimerase
LTASRIERRTFGEAYGEPCSLLTLKNDRGMSVSLSDYGATVTQLWLPDRDGSLADVVLGFDDVQGYVTHGAYFGATIGRVANRIRNACFELDGQEYRLAATDGRHHLHGGRRGWDRRLWQAEAADTPRGPCVVFRRQSTDGEEGYPGNVRASVAYTLTDDGELVVEMEATSDRDTPLGMAHHGYWNLGGHRSGDVLGHELSLLSARYTPGDPVVPIGIERGVDGTPFDFRERKPIGRDLAAAGGNPAGFDHNWVVSGPPGELRPVAEVLHPGSGRHLALASDQPGVQFYSGNFLDGQVHGKGGQPYARHAGLCLETQAFPDAINVPAWQSQVVLRGGGTYRHRMLHRFSISS